MEVSEDSLLAAVDKLLNTTECEARQGFDYTPCNLYLQVQEIRFYKIDNLILLQRRVFFYREQTL